ncbi:poly adp-ribose polymerase family [Anaeramoeba flamelloides]|uniref:Poly adp-ribose polymerase family n=1 Tax=Anaeramoeba flamelloides TaxID=1746091 RepID=A0ABQ8ZA34_9EUKA|nr:poly adp-ribose polymerase family [Anaeramoeba flamelloides]
MTNTNGKEYFSFLQQLENLDQNSKSGLSDDYLFALQLQQIEQMEKVTKTHTNSNQKQNRYSPQKQQQNNHQYHQRNNPRKQVPNNHKKKLGKKKKKKRDRRNKTRPRVHTPNIPSYLLELQLEEQKYEKKKKIEREKKLEQLHKNDPDFLFALKLQEEEFKPKNKKNNNLGNDQNKERIQSKQENKLIQNKEIRNKSQPKNNTQLENEKDLSNNIQNTKQTNEEKNEKKGLEKSSNNEVKEKTIPKNLIDNDEIFALKLHKEELEKQKLFYCGICNKHHKGETFFELNCSHRFCIECGIDYVLKGPPKNESLCCPTCKKNELFTPIDPKNLLQLGFDEKESNQIFVSYLIKQNPDQYIYCPNLSCNKVLENTGVLRVFCPYCSIEFCSSCQTKWHDGLTCDEFFEEDLNQGGGLSGVLRENPYVVDLIISTTFLAAVSNRSRLIFKPFPTIISPKRNPDLIKNILLNIPPVLEMQKAAKSENSIKTFLDYSDKRAYKLLRWLLITNKVSLQVLRSDQTLKSFNSNHQFKFTKNNSLEVRKFNDMKRNCSECAYAFHGSSAENWYSIMRYGLKNCSNTELMMNGAARGPGIYLASMPTTSISYSRTQRNWPHSIISKNNFSCLSICDVILDSCVKKDNSVVVIRDNNKVVLKMLIINPRINSSFDSYENFNHLNRIFGYDKNRVRIDELIVRHTPKRKMRKKKQKKKKGKKKKGKKRK